MDRLDNDNIVIITSFVLILSVKYSIVLYSLILGPLCLFDIRNQYPRIYIFQYIQNLFFFLSFKSRWLLFIHLFIYFF